MLVEDQQGIRDLIDEFLKRNDYTVLCASDGVEALKIANAHKKKIDLVVTDVVMPNMGGHELASRLNLSRPETKVLFMSGNPDQASLNASSEAPASVLQKPFPLDTLLQRVRSLLHQ